MHLEDLMVPPNVIHAVDQGEYQENGLLVWVMLYESIVTGL